MKRFAIGFLTLIVLTQAAQAKMSLHGNESVTKFVFESPQYRAIYEEMSRIKKYQFPNEMRFNGITFEPKAFEPLDTEKDILQEFTLSLSFVSIDASGVRNECRVENISIRNMKKVFAANPQVGLGVTGSELIWFSPTYGDLKVICTDSK